MKQWIQQIGFAMVLAVSTVQFSQAQSKMAVPTRAVHKIEVNVRYIKHDASIYQFERVDEDVDRVVAAWHTVNKSLPADSDEAKNLAQVIHELRSAQWDRNVNRLLDAAGKLSVLSADLLKSGK